jgi:hypothetical protein
MTTSTEHHDAKIASMRFASVYPHYQLKVVKMGELKKN